MNTPAMLQLPRFVMLGIRRTPTSSCRETSASLFSRSVSSRIPKPQSQREQDSANSGYMEQLKKHLLPEVFPAVDSPKGERRRDDDPKGERRRDDDSDFKKTLVRDATVLIREQLMAPYLPKTDEDAQGEREDAPQLVVLDGSKGVGKTSLVEQTAAFARLKGFIVLYIPYPESWTDGRGFFCAKAVDEMDPVMDGLSAVRYYDRPHQMHQVFKDLLQTHSGDLAQIVCDTQFSTSLTESCVSLLDLVELGDRLLSDIDSNWRQTPTSAGEVFHQLIRQLCACEDKPVALIIDNYDKFVGMTCLVNDRLQRMHSNAVRVVGEDFGRYAIEKTSQEMRNGFVMLAVDPTHAFEPYRKSRVRSGLDFPLSIETLSDPSGKKWCSSFRKRVQDSETKRNLYIDVPRLTSSELKALCSTFVQGGPRKLIDGDQEEETARLVALAGGRGDLMRKIAVSR
ncbi:unnamed protein product [Chondrus crispus]|uniref:Small ribosomal subunit protein mS29 n=1 Tax=Chondrus crispus TaxID=2769 RepID=R7QAX8_CHOCR|nr:unnamed protein product [Chondrus crispus]CDF34556.1 unnamed protein product [Chondrus crispus]|eukprot:XP_005714375.1 unnamed protein product [Chondrus crispus]